MALNRGKDLYFERSAELATRRNFSELQRAFRELGPLAFGYMTEELSLVAGDNPVVPTVAGPRGRITVFQTAASTLTDKGLDSNGRWIVTASAPCKARFVFLP